jgi:hypothetical protein
MEPSAAAWRYVAARAAGASHRRVGKPCQDAFACETPARGLLVAMADGAGSAENSERGASIAVAAAVDAARRGLQASRADHEALARDAALCAREAVIAEAARAGLDPASYASTLLLLLMTPDGGATAQAGDGVIVARDAEGEWRWLFWPEHGEYANTTTFLTSADWPAGLRSATLPVAVADVALTTDGLERLVLRFDAQAVHDPFFEAMFRPLWRTADPAAVGHLNDALESFLLSEQVAGRTDDDVTLALATRRSPQAQRTPEA